MVGQFEYYLKADGDNRTLTDAIRKEHTLRPMNSFDSNLTARAGDPKDTDYDAKVSSDPDSESEVNGTNGREAGNPDNTLVFGSSKILTTTKYQPGIFSILQSLTGIRDRIPSSSVDPTTGGSGEVTPEDDPRFVLWGTHLSLNSSPAISPTSISSAQYSAKPLPQTRERMIIAASIERWVAQLTSVLDYDELLNFYLTFRTFITPVDLCRLLICRFQWSLVHSDTTSTGAESGSGFGSSLAVPVPQLNGKGSGSNSPTSVDASVRRIVRLRTFVAIKYWIQTFFAVDFLPNRELRMMFADWLNTAGEDPNVAGYPDALVWISITYSSKS